MAAATRACEGQSKENEQGIVIALRTVLGYRLDWSVYDSMGCWGGKLSTARGRSGFELLSTDDHLNVFAFAWMRV